MSLNQSSLNERARTAARLSASLRAQAKALPIDDRGLEALRAVKAWQAKRLASSHADLLGSERYGDAARFFLNDLYGPQDLSGRDKDLERLLPMMIKLLPEKALLTIVKAIELDALSEQLDRALADQLQSLQEFGVAGADFENLYGQAYCLASGPAQRAEQTAAVLDIGQSLERLVRQPFLGTLLASMSGPARVAGLSVMHDFLMRGFGAFKRMNGASVFLAEIYQRESSEDARIRIKFAAQKG